MSRDPIWIVLGWSVAVLLMVNLQITSSSDDRIFNMDQNATCGQAITVSDSDVVLIGRSNATPANPPLECTMYLSSEYTNATGDYSLQIIIDEVDIQNCLVHVDLYNGKGASGRYLLSLGCHSNSIGIAHTNNSDLTVQFFRPLILTQMAYTFTLKIQSWRDKDDGGNDTTTTT